MSEHAHEEHYDHEGDKMGMWIFLFTELFLFGGLFLAYAVFRVEHADAFHHAAEELNSFVGTINTIVLLVSSMTVAMSITAVQKAEYKKAMGLLIITLVFALIFMVNKYFEWGHKIHLGIYPGSDVVLNMDRGELLFFGLYYMMTGIHALHIIIGSVLIAVVIFKIRSGKVNAERYVLAENAGLYWHLVDLIWIFLFPLMYLAT